MNSRFTELSTEEFYDAEDAIYRSFWDSEGGLHWGVFDDSTGSDFLKACDNLNAIMAGKARLDEESRLLDLGCGNGKTSMWLAAAQKCRVTGVDLSGVRVANAIEALEDQPDEIRARVGFQKGSGTDLPFPDASFTHVWSQAVIYHIPDKEKVLQEAYRVLEDGGLLVFDDLIKPKPDISAAARTYVYDRLLFDTDFSFHTYQEALVRTGFRVLEAHDLSPHLKMSYQRLGEMAGAKEEALSGKYQALAHAYGQMVKAVQQEELGWGFYVCQK